MLQIIVPEREFFDENTETFINIKSYKLNLEHSLLSISKWESKYHKPFFARTKKDVKTNEEMLYYIKCMTINTNIPDFVYLGLTTKNYKDIEEYINDPMTATTVKKQGGSSGIVTSELIYYWMIACQVPFECEKWHINRLLMIIQVCNSMNNPKNSKVRPDLLARKNLNAARRAKLHSKG